MPDKLELEVVTPDRLVLSEEVDEVILPSQDGYMGVLPGHVPLLAQLDIGELSYRSGKQTRLLAVAGGFAEVTRDSVRIMAETSEAAEEIDAERAERSKESAERELKANPTGDDFRRLEVRLKKAISRISVKRRLGV